MLRMLIVDDEPIIVEGLYELFAHIDHLELELHQAMDGFEAMEIANKLRIDILLTDFNMPEMDGHALQLAIQRIWPRCKIIFLTGFNEFSYIQSTMRSGALDFVLKTEGDEPIIAAVEKAIKSIEEDHNVDRLIYSARTQMEMALPSMRKDYLKQMISGDPEALLQRARRFEELQIPLDPENPVYIILGRIDRWRDHMADGDRQLFAFSVQNIVEEYFANGFAVAHYRAEHERMVWLLQPAGREGNQSEIVLGTLESIQSASKQFMKLATSFVVTREPISWEQLPQAYDRLSLMFEKGLGLSEETLLSDERIFAVEQQPHHAGIRRIRLLDQYLSQKEEEKFFAHFDEVMQFMEDEQTLQTGLSLEVFYELTAIFIAHINRMGLLTELSNDINISKLLSIQEHRSWLEVNHYFRNLAARLFRSMSSENEQASHEVVHMIHEYIDAHLHGDLSLNRLAGLVYLTPFYVSRLYKQITQQSISEYIADKRLAKAKQLLSETPLKIHEVGIQIGYDSPAYFTRFFKKMSGLTPQEYRDSFKRI